MNQYLFFISMEPMELPMLKEKEKPLNKGLRMLLIIIPMELGGRNLQSGKGRIS
jgi:hypothetical protein